MRISPALLAAAIVLTNPIADPAIDGIGPMRKPKGKLTPIKKPLPKLQSDSLRRMLRKAKP